MNQAKPCFSPMASTCSLTASDGKPCADANLYTRLDLAFVVHKVSKYMYNPLEPHWQAVKRILCYLKYNISTSLLISKAAILDLQAFSDSDWAVDLDDKISVGAHCIFQGPKLIS